MPPRRGFIKDMIAEPTASAPRSKALRGTCPSYFGGGRFNTENGLARGVIVTRARGGRAKSFLEVILCFFEH